VEDGRVGHGGLLVGARESAHHGELRVGERKGEPVPDLVGVSASRSLHGRGWRARITRYGSMCMLACQVLLSCSTTFEW